MSEEHELKGIPYGIADFKDFRGKEYKLYVIIDEYDNFANTILSDPGEEEYRSITHHGKRYHSCQYRRSFPYR